MSKGQAMFCCGEPMVPTRYSREKTTGLLAAATAFSGIAIGLLSLAGPLAVGALALFAAGVALVLFSKAIYRALVALATLLLACVFVEPSPSDILFAAAMPLGLLCGAVSLKAAKPVLPVLSLMLLYFIFSIPGIAVAPDANGALRYYTITCYLFLLAVFLSLYAQPHTVGGLQRAYLAAAFLSLAAGAAGLLGVFPELFMADAYRVKGLFKDPNVYGPFFVPAVILLLEDLRSGAVWKGPKALDFIGIVLLSAGIVVSYSRAAWINLVVSIGIFMMLNTRRVSPSKLAAAGIAVAAALAILVSFFALTDIQNNETVSFLLDRAQIQDYDSNRFSTQSAGLQLASLHPAFGVGPGQFENRIAAITGMRLSSHNLYIRVAAESGVAAFLFFFLAVGCVLMGLLLDHRRQTGGSLPAVRNSGTSPAVLLAILGGILVNSLVVDTLHWRHLWFFIGLSLYRLGEGQSKETEHA